MNSQKLSFYKFVLKYGLIIAAIPVLYNIILLIQSLHLDYDTYGEGIGAFYGETRIFILPIILFIAIYQYRKLNTETLKLLEAIKIGLWIVLVSSIVIIIYNLIFRLLIEPNFSTKFYDINRAQIFQELIECCDYSQADLENHERTNGSLWNSLTSSIALDLFFTLFFSLVIGLIMKKKAKKQN